VARFSFRNAQAASQKADALRRSGYQVTQRATKFTLRLKRVQIGPYPTIADVKRIEAHLESHGIAAFVVHNPPANGYTVAAGAFRKEGNAERRLHQLQQLGFSSVSVVPRDVTRTRYLVTGVSKPASATGTHEAGNSAKKATEQSQVMVFGPPPAPYPGSAQGNTGKTSANAGKFRIGLDNARVEAGALTDSYQQVNSSDYAHLAAGARWRPTEHWTYRISGRIDGYLQTGSPNLKYARVDYGDSYIRYRSANMRITAGAQTVIWGRVDEIPPTDRLSVQDATRATLDPLQERRRAVPTLRVEDFQGAYKLDALWVPWFRPAELADKRSIWSPVDKTEGRLLGIPNSPGLAYLVKNGSFAGDNHGEGGYGIRLSHDGERLDYAVTVERARRSLPYYQLNRATWHTLLATNNPGAALAAANGDTFIARHPMSWVFGGDVGFQTLNATWRFEAAYLQREPATTTDFRMITTNAIDWVAGVEFYPGDSNARVNLQVAGHRLIAAPSVLDLTQHYAFNGSIEDTFSHERWRAKLRFWLGLDKKDIYLNPEIAYIGWEPNEFYIGAHYFDGAERTIDGFYQNDSLIVVGWRARY